MEEAERWSEWEILEVKRQAKSEKKGEKKVRR
jgi:hypothetical protein